MNQLIEDFCNWFERKKPLNGKKSRIEVYHNTRQDNVKLSGELPRREIYSAFTKSDKQKIGTAYVGYGYGCGIVSSFGKNITITHQNKYEETPIWHLDASGCLGNIFNDAIVSDNPEQIEAAKNEELIKWLICPEGNLEIGYDIFKLLIYPILSSVFGRMPGKSHKEINLVLPMISESLTQPDWEQLMNSFHMDNTRIHIHPNAHLQNPDDDERIYSFVEQEGTKDEYYIVNVVEKSSSGEPISVGAYAFSRLFPKTYIQMKSIEEHTIEISRASYELNKIDKSVLKNVDILVANKLPMLESMNSFLGTHTPSFYREFFTAKGIDPCDEMKKKIFQFLSNHKSLQTEQICAKLCGEDNLLNISLSDMVTTSALLEDDQFFESTTISSRGRTSPLRTIRNLFGKQEVPLQSLPANYGRFSWECVVKSYTSRDYGKTTTEQLIKMPQDELISMLICYFSPATTENVAEELLYVFDPSGEPTARFVAELFWYLYRNPKFKVKTKSTVIQDFTVLETKNSMVTPSKETQSSFPQQLDNKIMGFRIEDLNLSVRSYNALKRANISTIGDIVRRPKEKFLNTRNMGTKQFKEVFEALEKYGVHI